MKKFNVKVFLNGKFIKTIHVEAENEIMLFKEHFNAAINEISHYIIGGYWEYITRGFRYVVYDR